MPVDPRLLEPVPLRCGRALPNRFALAPLTNTQSHPDGSLSDDEFRWLTERGRGGFGLVSTCATFVSREGHCWRGQLGASSDHHLPGLRRLAAGVRAGGAVVICQLQHGGAQASLAPDHRLSTVDRPGVRGATLDDLDRVIDDFVAAARRCELAGFHGVEIHGANGYLITQFLAPLDNPRRDGFGGTLARRARLARAIVQAVREAVSSDFAVGIRLSPVDLWTRRGLRLADSVQVAQWLADDGVDWVHLSLGDAAGSPPHEPVDVPVAEVFRGSLPPEVPVLAAGRVWTAAQAERALDAGADVVVVGRAGIAHADWPRRLAEPGFVPTRPPWSPAYLRSQGVGPDLITYAGGMGLVAG